MRVYSIFDDLDKKSIAVLKDAGVDLVIHPKGVPRPDKAKMKDILERYDAVMIGTSQKMTSDMFADINTRKIIATASVGLDHISVPEEKRKLIKVVNTPGATAQAAAEYTFAAVLSWYRKLFEGDRLYRDGKNNKAMSAKPRELSGKVLGVVGAGSVSERIIALGKIFGMEVLCWTRNPSAHKNLSDIGVQFVSLDELAEKADVVSVNIPLKTETHGLISFGFVEKMKPDAVFVSISRLQSVNLEAIISKLDRNPLFCACLDIDVDGSVIERIKGHENIIVTPHIAGGTVETRKRMFFELATKLASIQKTTVQI